MEFGYTIIYVNDVTATIEFYEKAFGMMRKFVDESNTYAELNSGATTLAFAENTFAHSLTNIDHYKNQATSTSGGFEVVLITDDVEHSFRVALENGAEKITDPETKPWGQVVAYVRDLNGVIVEIATPIKS